MQGDAGGMNKISLKMNNFTREDIREMARIHKEAIKEGFLGSLGEKVLEIIYSHASKSKLSILIMAIDQEKRYVCGFICGTLHLSNFYKEFLRKRASQAFVFMLPKLFSFNTLRKILETLFYPTKKEFLNIPKAEILNFVVKKDYRGTDLAQKLFFELINNFKAKSIKKIKIVTGIESIAAQKFYEKMGAQKIGLTQVHKGQQSTVYVYQIPYCSETSMKRG